MAFTDVVTWLGENWLTLVEVTGGLLGVASLITGLTNTPKDDAFVAKLQGWLGRLSVVTHKDAPNSLKMVGSSAKPTSD